MVIFPNAKINLGLQVLRKRPDGYHDLSSVFYPVPIADSLEILPSSRPTHFTIWNRDIPGDLNQNLILRAYRLLRETYNLPEVEIHLIKNIPMGAGLGGGSADATFALCALNDLFSLQLSSDTLEDLALELGSDCPFFVTNRPALVHGRGEHLTAIPHILRNTHILVVSPETHVSTAEAFGGIAPNDQRPDLAELIQLPREQWKHHIANDFEQTIFPLHTELSVIKQWLYDCGAFYASLTGTGSSIYGLFDHLPEVTPPDFGVDCQFDTALLP
ncbi:MAG: 4-(cytidine 5'-diphospho)-2-C-methyl-D-erythritol kinase [Flavobacteriales bacterium]|nr:4-(cytidine 5'-diphospho)-2-C-methyl-D-erythritol kinase [Flavobacteriales bacterium]